MAESVHLYLKLNGQDIRGESSQTSLGRENSIECVQFVQSVSTARDTSTGQAAGRRQYAPIVIVKRIDRSSPLLVKGLAENQVVAAVFKFFRPNPIGDGTTEQFYTIEIKEGRIAGVKTYVLDTLDPATSNRPPLE
jgi:type VI secretion system secreted protein Hcp